MDLFSMGVIDDPDKPRQHRPAPVRCLESELLPPVPRVARCYECHNHALTGKALCSVCERRSDLGEKTKRNKNTTARRFMRLRTTMICSGGILVETKANTRTLVEFVDAGNARWATRRDLHRLGLPDDGPRVAILIGWPR